MQMSILSDKIGTALRLSLQLPEDLRRDNLLMSTGYDPLNCTWETVVKYHGNLEPIEEELDADIEILTERYAIITLPLRKIIMLSSYAEIEYIEKPKLVAPMIDSSLNKSCITPVQQNPDYRLTGRGVIVGVIDSGIDYAHPDFINEDGTSRILSIWDQTINGCPPYGFKLGSEYTNEMINNALQMGDIYERMNYLPHADTHSHGTHVTGIAAGNGRSSGGRIKGAAPEASIIAVKLGLISKTTFSKSTEIMRALKYIIEQAELYNMPVAINLSYGTNEGANDSTSLFETFIDQIAFRWKNVICAATGNEGSAGHHKSGILQMNYAEEIEFVVTNTHSSLLIEIWKSYADKFDVEIISPSGDSTGRISFRAINQRFRFGRTDIYIEFADATPFSENECVLIALFSLDRQMVSGIWAIRLYPVNISSGQYDAWMPTTEVSGLNTYFLMPTTHNTVTSPSTARNVISVGGYDSHTDKICHFSGRGKLPYNDIPDLTAPAENITSAIPGGGYDSFTGTSMACPHVTGSAALLMQWGIVKGNDPYLYGQKIKACLKSGAKKDSLMVYPNAEWGYGRLCLMDSFKYLEG